MGENGAGKSTLMKILSGVYSDYDGELDVDGRPVRFANVRARGSRRHRHHPPGAQSGARAQRRRQHLPRPRAAHRRADRSTARRAPLRRAACLSGLASSSTRMRASARCASASSNWSRSPRRCRSTARILIMDEPTSALSPAECERLFRIVRQLAADGVAVVYISHRIDEVMQLADRVTVFRDGRHVLTTPIARARRGQRSSPPWSAAACSTAARSRAA